MKHRRIRTVGRWGVWVVTALALISIPVSVWVEPEVFIQHKKGNPLQSIKPWSLHLVDGRIVWYSEYVHTSADWTTYNLHDTGPTITNPTIFASPGWVVELDIGVDGFGLWTSTGSWWQPRLYDDRPFAYRFDLPLMYPAILMVGWSLWLMRGVRRRRLVDGCCVKCGYSLEGLSGGACPECGEGKE